MSRYAFEQQILPNNKSNNKQFELIPNNSNCQCTRIIAPTGVYDSAQCLVDNFTEIDPNYQCTCFGLVADCNTQQPVSRVSPFPGFDSGEELCPGMVGNLDTTSDCLQVNSDELSCATKPGLITRIRQSIIDKYDKGNNMTQKSCTRSTSRSNCQFNTVCPDANIDCVVSGFKNVGACSASCGDGLQYQTREILVPSSGNGKACPPEEQLSRYVTCNLQPCPTNCEFSPWQNVSTCSEPCGGGIQSQSRTIIKQAENGGTCDGDLSRTISCNTEPCPIDCVSEVVWGECEGECGGNQGIRRGTLNISTPAQYGGTPCPTQQNYEQSCITPSCGQQECLVGPWSDWGPCEGDCGSNTGIRKRTRQITRYPDPSSLQCPHLAEIDFCTTDPCPIDCEVNEWVWDQCQGTCGTTGTQAGTRTVKTPPQYGGQECPELQTTRSCETEPCPIDCQVSEWQNDGVCSATCGGGLQLQSRTITVQPQHNGQVCPELSQYVVCNTQPCPVDCEYSPWQNNGTCSATCGGGKQLQTRTVTKNAEYGGTCDGSLSQEIDCNTQPCPINCQVSDWEWGDCQGDCDKTGSQTGTRTITVQPQYGGQNCPELETTRPCIMDPCPAKPASSKVKTIIIASSGLLLLAGIFLVVWKFFLSVKK